MIRNETEELLMAMYDTIVDFNARMKRTPIAEELAVMHDVDIDKARKILRYMRDRKLIEINYKSRPAKIVLPKKQEKKLQDNTKKPAAVFIGNRQLIKNVKVGQRITMTRYEGDKDYDDLQKSRAYEVIRIYPYHVLGVDIRTGMRRSICYGDLVIKGLEMQRIG